MENTPLDSLWAIIFSYIYYVSIRKGIAIVASTQKLRRKIIIIAYAQTEERKNMFGSKNNSYLQKISQ